MSGFGSMLKDYLEYYKISQTDFANRLGISLKHMNEILNGNAELSCDLMSTISLLTNIDINLILKVENKRKINKYLLDKYKNETGIKEFLNRFNINEMIKRKWFRPKQESSLSQIAVDLLEYLQVKDFDNLNTYMDKRVLYKKRDDADLTKIYLWITRCDILIKDIKINEYNKNNLPLLLQELREERMKKFNSESLIKIFSKYGIYLVIEDALKGSKIRGAMMVKGKNPTIYMTKYLKEKSSFYFALYHELGHVKTDYNKAKNKVIVDDEEKESKADLFALNEMIDHNLYNVMKEDIKSASSICLNNSIPLSFLYSRLAYDNIISYNNKEYLSHREYIE